MKIFVKVRTGSLEDKLLKLDDFNYLAFVKEMPARNKANLKLIHLIAKQFNVSDKNVTIKTPISRKKIIEVNLT